MSRITLLSAADRPVQPWKNGGGRTREIAVFPIGSELDRFDWRISMASVSMPGRFSHFNDIDRVIAVIEGRLDLVFAEAMTVRLDPCSTPHSFPGDVAVTGVPLSGEVVDLNLMMRRGRWSGAIERLAGPGMVPVAITSPHAVFMFTSEGRWRWLAEHMSMRCFDAIWLEAAEGTSIILDSVGDVYHLSLSPANI